MKLSNPDFAFIYGALLGLGCGICLMSWLWFTVMDGIYTARWNRRKRK